MKISLFRHIQQQFIAIKNRAIRDVASAGMLSVLIGCAAVPQGQQSPAPAVQTAQNLEQRAAQAYARGDAPAALADYLTTVQLYASLALGEPQARAQLSLARVQADLGQADAARQSTAGVLAQTGLPVALQVLAHGRMAALELGLDQISAQRHLDAAQALCAAACEQASALQALRARLALAE
ncbi:MAG: hypothetical protein RLZZ401_1280, partial [Pseudomonadota bacterium]